MTTVRAVFVLLAFAAVAACSSASKDDDASTVVERTKVATMSGTANVPIGLETPTTPTADEEAGKCRHSWESMATWTHAWVDDGGELANILLCTPIRCQKCGAVRHECARKSGR